MRETKYMKLKVSRLLISIVIALSAGLIGSVATSSEITSWYVTINKPSFNPPNWIFGPVWTLLYILIGIALFRVWQKSIKSDQKIASPNKRKAIMVWGLQLFLNTLWSFLFFGLNSPAVGLIGIILLWISIVWTIKLFLSIDKLAALLLFPYLAWVSFATVLNLAIWQLNP